jgi:hypothetical protein
MGFSSDDAGGRALAAGPEPITLVRCGAIFANGSNSALLSTCGLTGIAARCTGRACTNVVCGTAVIALGRWRYA